MKTEDYIRKISAKEAQEGFIFILKDKLNFFPKCGSNFKLIAGDLEKEVAIESYPCTCKGTDLPHEHYFIPWEGLKEGDKVKIVKELDNYILQINP